METAPAREALQEAAQRALAYMQSVRDRPVTVSARALQRLDELKHPLPQTGLDAREVVRRLDEIGSPATVATTGGRYFGLVIGGALPATVAANWLAAAWDQNACFRWTSPIAAVLEDVSLQWLRELFELPSGVEGAFVTGASMANMAALASARHALLSRLDWDVEAKGLYGAPELRVIVSEEVHVTVLKALALLGLGRERVIQVPTDRQGRMRIDSLPVLDNRTIICVQAGNVNTGDFDPAAEVCRRAKEAGAWVHVDGAFGLWALANRDFAALTKGLARPTPGRRTGINGSTFLMTAASSLSAERPISARQCQPARLTWPKVPPAIANRRTTPPNLRGGRAASRSGPRC
jgi:glutamate/tyrosine decarboxylase-like PLP-dependent enzyme